MIWTNGGDTNLPSYLARSFGGSSSLLPTLAGLWLCSDTSFGRPEPFSRHDMLASRSSNTRHLQFAPAAASAQAAIARACLAGRAGSSELLAAPVVAIPPVASSGGQKEPGLADALLRLQDLCCLKNVALTQAMGCDLILQTSASLARLVAGACVSGRLKLQLTNTSSSSGSSSSSSTSSCVWQQLGQLVTAWPLAPRYKLAWKAAWHWLLQAAQDDAAAATATRNGQANSMDSEDPAAAAAAAAAAAGPASNAQQQQLPPPPRPLVFTGMLQPSSGSIAARMSPTPELAVLLITEAAAAELMSAQVFPQGMQNPMLQFASAMGSRNMHTPQGMYPAFMHACGLWIQGKDVPAAAACGVFVLDNLVVVPHPAEPLDQPMKVCGTVETFTKALETSTEGC